MQDEEDKGSSTPRNNSVMMYRWCADVGEVVVIYGKRDGERERKRGEKLHVCACR